MLDSLITWSLRHRLAVLVAWGGIAVYGVLAFGRLSLDAFPDTAPVQVQINTVASALGPLEIERQVTAPLEQAVSGLPDLLEVRSVSRFGFSQVVAVFEDGADLWTSRQAVWERLATVSLPAGIRAELGPVATGLGEVFHYLVTGEGVSLAELRTAQDWILRPRLRSVSGVAEINGWGGDERQVHVIVDPTELRTRGLTLGDLVRALESGNRNAGGGTIDAAGESTVVQGAGVVTRPEEIAAIVVVSRGGIPVRVGDVARVAEGREIRRGAVTADGKGEAVLGLGFMLAGGNGRDVASSLRLRLDEIRKGLPEGVGVETVYDRTDLVDAVLRTVRTNLVEGAALVVAVLFALLGNLRAGLIVASAIPLSLLFAFGLMERMAIAASLMSLGAIDFGLIVDSSVIQVENAARRLQDDRGRRGATDVVREAVLEVRRPTILGELILLVVYLPVLTLGGIEGKLFRPMAWTVIFALAGSMALSLTLIPVLTSIGLGDHARSGGPPAIVRRVEAGYGWCLSLLSRRRGWVIGAAAAMLAGSIPVALRLGTEFVPRLAEGAVVINTVRLAGVSVEESVRYGTRIERMLLDRFPGEIARVWTRTGTAETATDPMGVEVSDVFVTLKPRNVWTKATTQEELVREMERELSSFPGMRAVFTQPIEMRVNEMTAGIRSDLGVKIFGEDLDHLKSVGQDVAAALRTVPGAADVTAEPVTGQPLVRVEVDREAAGRLGVPVDEVLAVVEALAGIEAGTMQQGDRRFPIVVRLHEAYRRDREGLGRATVTTAGGIAVPLSSVARLVGGEGPSAIQREWGERRIVVQANVRGRDVGSFVNEARRVIERRVTLPAGVRIELGGAWRHLQDARRRLAVVIPLAVAAVLTLLYLTYGRISDVVRVFAGVPFSAVGGVAALAVRGIPFSISAGIGFVALIGIAVLGDMVLVSTVRRAEAEGVPLDEAVRAAAVRRLRPILMTALVAALGFLPMALNTGIGAEVQRPLATVVIGGVISSTVLTLLVLPALLQTFSSPPFSRR